MNKNIKHDSERRNWVIYMYLFFIVFFHVEWVRLYVIFFIFSFFLSPFVKNENMNSLVLLDMRCLKNIRFD